MLGKVKNTLHQSDSKQLYLKKDEVSQPYILYLDRDLEKINRYLENVGKVGSLMI